MKFVVVVVVVVVVDFVVPGVAGVCYYHFQFQNWSALIFSSLPELTNYAPKRRIYTLN